MRDFPPKGPRPFRKVYRPLAEVSHLSDKGARPFEKVQRPLEKVLRPVEKVLRPSDKGERPFGKVLRPFEQGERPFCEVRVGTGQKKRRRDEEREATGDRPQRFAKARPLEPGHRCDSSQTVLHYPKPAELIGHPAGRRLPPSHYQARPAPPREFLQKFADRRRGGLTQS